MLIFPQPLQKGDWVGLIAPASPAADQEEINLCVDSLQAMGYCVKKGDALSSVDENPAYSYLSRTAKERASDINQMFADEKIRGIFCLRGGYGSAQLLKYLDYPMIRRHPKVLVGYSDITNLHVVLQERCGFVTFHGPMVRPNMVKGLDAYSWKSLCMALNLQYEMEFMQPAKEFLTVLAEGTGTGILSGGNLSVLARLCGTEYQPQMAGKILYLEDVGENIPRIDMYLTQMAYAGIFSGITGILLGGFTEYEDKRYPAPETVEDLFQQRFAMMGIPIMGNIFSDHRHPMGTLPLGVSCTINTYEASVSCVAVRA